MNKKEEFQKLQYVFGELVKKDPNFLKNEIFGIRGEGLKKLKLLKKELENSIESNENSKGKILEKISEFLFIQNRIYEVITNLRDSSNEIDLLIRLNDLGKIEKDIFPKILKDNEEFILECKNYNSNIGVTWIGKFYSLLKQRNLKFGIIVSVYPLAGRGEWDSSKGLVKKIFLKENISILNICKEDIDMIIEGKSTIIEIIENKFNNLRYFTDINKYKSMHPAEVS